MTVATAAVAPATKPLKLAHGLFVPKKIVASKAGTVSYAGVKDAHAAAAEWRNIVSIAVDSQYAIGLTESGEVLLAGDVSPFVDYGRNQAKQWKDMSFIAAGDSLIIGLTNKGSLQMVGNPNLYKADNFDVVCTKAINALIK